MESPKCFDGKRKTGKILELDKDARIQLSETESIVVIDCTFGLKKSKLPIGKIQMHPSMKFHPINLLLKAM